MKCAGLTRLRCVGAVANADIIVGTASGADELSRLRIIENVASTNLGEVPSAQIDTPSIESVSVRRPLLLGLRVGWLRLLDT
eukprot:3536579-Rhodomonas_salina.1